LTRRKFHQLTGFQEFWAPEPIDEVAMAEGRPGNYASYTPELSTRPFDPQVADSPDGQWRVVPFSFGLPTTGLDADVAQGHRLLHRFAFPTYHRVIWVQSSSRHRTRYDILETCIGDVDRVTTFDVNGRPKTQTCNKMYSSSNFRLHPVHLEEYGSRPSSLRPSDINTTVREWLDQSSPVLLVRLLLCPLRLLTIG
jgi:hypothetical protein